MQRILFVCMGNICRSPAAEGVMKAIIEKRGLSKEFEVDSAGTIGYHAGEQADARMRQAARARGIDLTSIARQVLREDLATFDHIIAMDRDNLFHLHSMDGKGVHTSKIRLMTDYHPDPRIDEVPDPYYGGAEGFDLVLDILEVACERLLDGLPKL